MSVVDVVSRAKLTGLSDVISHKTRLFFVQFPLSHLANVSSTPTFKTPQPRPTMYSRVIDINRHNESINCLEFSDDGAYLASADDAGLLVITNVAKGEERTHFEFPDSVTALLWVPRSGNLFVGLANCELPFVSLVRLSHIHLGAYFLEVTSARGQDLFRRLASRGLYPPSSKVERLDTDKRSLLQHTTQHSRRRCWIQRRYNYDWRNG